MKEGMGSSCDKEQWSGGKEKWSSSSGSSTASWCADSD